MNGNDKRHKKNGDDCLVHDYMVVYNKQWSCGRKMADREFFKSQKALNVLRLRHILS